MRVVTSLLMVSCLVVLLTGCGGSTDEDPGAAGPAAVHEKGSGSRGRERVTLRTPEGRVDVDSGIDAAELGVPLFPGARLRDDDSSSLTRVTTGGAVSMSGCFHSTATLKEIVAFYEEHLKGATVVSSGDSAMIMAELDGGVVAQVICSDDPDSGEREIVITSTRSE